jgi:hypothetical protein
MASETKPQTLAEKVERSWHSCKFNYAANGDSESARKIRELGGAEIMGCTNPEIIELKVYEVRTMPDLGKGRIKVALFRDYFAEVALSEYVSSKELKDAIQETTARCRHCMFYKPK